MLGKQCTVAATLLYSRWPVQAMNTVTKASENSVLFSFIWQSVQKAKCWKVHAQNQVMQKSIVRTLFWCLIPHITLEKTGLCVWLYNLEQICLYEF